MKKHVCVKVGEHDECRCKCGTCAYRRHSWAPDMPDPHPNGWETSGDCLGERLWIEDDACLHDPTAEHEHQAYARLTQRDLKADMDARDKSKDQDWGDAFGYWLPEGYILVHAYDGASIYWNKPE